LEVTAGREAKKMPAFDDILEYKRGREAGREEGWMLGELTVRQIVRRFGTVPPSLEQRLSKLSLAELEEFRLRVAGAAPLDDLLE
jgi:hypothetical protein